MVLFLEKLFTSLREKQHEWLAFSWHQPQSTATLLCKLFHLELILIELGEKQQADSEMASFVSAKIFMIVIDLGQSRDQLPVG